MWSERHEQMLNGQRNLIDIIPKKVYKWPIGT